MAVEKSLFICGQSYVKRHEGEEYDDILIVEDNPSTETIREWAFQIMDKIRKLWHETKEVEAVNVYLDAAPAFHGVMDHLKTKMETDESISVALAYLNKEV